MGESELAAQCPKVEGEADKSKLNERWIRKEYVD
jgi:hypothetical protein